MCTSRGSDVKSYFRSKLFDKKKVAFEHNRMLRGLVNGVVTTTSVGVQGNEEAEPIKQDTSLHEAGADPVNRTEESR